MSNQRVKDLTTGSPAKLLIGFMLPMLLGNLFQQVYGVVDTVMVGRYLGVDALAGVGSTGSINFLIVGFCMGICCGFVIPVAHKFGQKDYDGLRRYVGNMIWLGGTVALTVTTVTAVLCRNILTWMNTPAETFGYAYDYILVIFLGIPFMILYNILSGIIRSLGDSRTPLLFLIFSSFLNIVLDILMIVPLQMGVGGAAWATVISQALSCVLCFFYIIRKVPMIHLKSDDMKFRWIYSKRLLGMGIPMGLQYSITALGCVILQIPLNGLGTAAVAAMTAASRVSNFCVCPFDAIGATAATFAGQNAGAGKLDRIRQGVRACGIMGIAYAAAIFVIIWFWGDKMSMLFIDGKEAQILTMSHRFLIFNGAAYFFLLYVNLLRFTIQGMGFSQLAVFAGVFELVARAGVGMYLVGVMGYDAICIANPAAWIMADMFLLPAYYFCIRKLGKIFQSGRETDI